MRIATYNVEWFDALFDRNANPLIDQKWSSRYNVTRADQWHAVEQVMHALDADCIFVVEAPNHKTGRSTVDMLERFVSEFGLRATQAALGFTNDTQQELAFLYDPLRCSIRHVPMSTPDFPRFDGTLAIDLDVDAVTEPIRFSKPPFEAELLCHDGRRITLIGAHLKSKAPHGAKSKDEAMLISIANRRKQLAQALWVRGRVDQVLDEGAEKQLFDPHATQMIEKTGADPFSARFYSVRDGAPLDALLDYILVGPSFGKQANNWRIWNPHSDPTLRANSALQQALITASDHFPITFDF